MMVEMVFRESETIELKKSTSELKEAVVSIAAMLNKHGKGEVYFGINDGGTVVGQEVSDATLREVSKAISDHVEPKIYPKIRELEINGKTCIKVEFSGSDAPYFAFGRAYARVGTENRPVSAKELERIMAGKSQSGALWDREACDSVSLEDMSTKKLKWFLKEAGLEFSTSENALKKLGLLRHGTPTNAAVMFFAGKPQKFFPNAKLRCAFFPSENSATILDMQEHKGDIIYLIGKAEDYLLKNIHMGMRVEGLTRIDVPEIDREAFREAVINAFCHRDYREYDSVNLAIFRDRVEIRSPGLLYGGLTIEKIKKEMVSERRNEVIAEMLHRIHYIEKWGRGIRLILSREPRTIFKEVGRHFVTIFRRKQFTPQATPQATPQVGLTELEAKILVELKADSGLSRAGLASKLGIRPDTVQEYLQKLRKKKLLARKGKTSAGHWEVAEGRK